MEIILIILMPLIIFLAVPISLLGAFFIQRRDCPFCCRAILKKAIKCHHCHSDLTKDWWKDL